MNIDQAAGLVDKVRWNGALRFTTQCPAHPDRSPSLSVREGHTSILLKCFAGCSYPEIVAALNMRSIDFKIGAGRAEIPSRLSARSRLQQVLRRPPLSSLVDVLARALTPSDTQLSRAAEHYPTLLALPYKEAMLMSVIVEVGPLYEMLWDGVDRAWNVGDFYPRYDSHNWLEVRDLARKEIAQTWRMR